MLASNAGRGDRNGLQSKIDGAGVGAWSNLRRTALLIVIEMRVAVVEVGLRRAS